MSWIRKKNNAVGADYMSARDTTVRRSEEITDIVDRMPMAFGRWVAIAIVIFAALLLLFGWIIKYPDTVTGHIKINSTNAPVNW